MDNVRPVERFFKRRVIMIMDNVFYELVNTIGDTVWVNPNQILWFGKVEGAEPFTRIYLSDGNALDVEGTPEKMIRDKFNKA